jgi:hypothetical protein
VGVVRCDGRAYQIGLSIINETGANALSVDLHGRQSDLERPGDHPTRNADAATGVFLGSSRHDPYHAGRAWAT